MLWRCILKSENEKDVDSDASLKIVQFLVDNFEEILAVPLELKQEAEQRILRANSAAQQPNVGF